MFSSLASFLFGSNTSSANSEASALAGNQPPTSGVEELSAEIGSLDAGNLIEVTSLTPSVTGAGDGNGNGNAAAATNRVPKRGKQKRNSSRQQNKRKGASAPAATPALKNGSQTATPTTKTAKQTPEQITTKLSSDSDDFDEDEWYIVEKDDDTIDDVSPPRQQSEEENTAPVIEIVQTVKSTIAASPTAQQRRLQHINSHSLYSGPRPHKQRNSLQKSRSNNSSSGSNNSANSSSSNSARAGGLSVSTLSPSRIANDGRNSSGPASPAGLTAADGGMCRSLYVVASPSTTPEKAGGALGIGGSKMDESWFVTPPPCFTSIGPINMATSPYENLLIEHPSMSVYHSIRSAQEASESYVKFDLGVKAEALPKEVKEKRPPKENAQRKNSQAVQQRSSAGFRLDRQSVAQLKQELMARTEQKMQAKNNRRDIRRSAINRANKAREVQSKNHNSRRSDRQHCKVLSGANNNRKSCF